MKYGVVQNIHIGQTYYTEEVEAYMTLFKEFCDVFFLEL